MIRNDEIKCFGGVAGGDAAKVCQKALLIFREGTDAAQRLATGLGTAVDNIEAAIKPFEAATMGGVMVSGEPFSMFGIYQLDRDANAADEAQGATACLSDAITDAFCGFEEMWRKALGAIGLSKSQWLLDYVCDEAHNFAMWGKVYAKEESLDSKYHDFTNGNYASDVQRLKSAILQAFTAAKADTQTPRKPIQRRPRLEVSGTMQQFIYDNWGEYNKGDAPIEINGEPRKAGDKRNYAEFLNLYGAKQLKGDGKTIREAVGGNIKNLSKIIHNCKRRAKA